RSDETGPSFRACAGGSHRIRDTRAPRGRDGLRERRAQRGRPARQHADGASAARRVLEELGGRLNRQDDPARPTTRRVQSSLGQPLFVSGELPAASSLATIAFTSPPLPSLLTAMSGTSLTLFSPRIDAS